MVGRLLVVGLLASVGQDSDVVAGLKASAIPLKGVEAGLGFQDMEPIAASLAEVDVVGMGEPTHGSREVFQFKHRMFEYLVERHGFTVFALESSMPDTLAMDRYVLHGEGTAKEAVQAQGFWTWSTQEVVDLIEWMRTYNSDPTHTKKLRVVGIDMQNQVGATLYFQRIFKDLGIVEVDAAFWESVSWEVPTDELMSKVADLLVRHLPTVREKKGAQEALLFERVGEVFRQAVDDRKIRQFFEIQSKAVPHLQETFGRVARLRSDAKGLPEDADVGLAFLSEHSQKMVEPKDIDAIAFRRYAKSLRDYARTKPKDASEFVRAAELLEFLAAVPSIEGLNVAAHRDSKMAENLLWVRDKYLPGEKVMLWAHNYHVSRLRSAGQPSMVGAFVEANIGEKYLPVGFSFYEGSFQAIGVGKPLQEWTVEKARKGSMDAVLHEVGMASFFLDLSRLEGGAAAWAEKPQTTRNYGAVNNPDIADAFYRTVIPRQMYGALVFISKTTRARPLNGG